MSLFFVKKLYLDEIKLGRQVPTEVDKFIYEK